MEKLSPSRSYFRQNFAKIQIDNFSKVLCNEVLGNLGKDRGRFSAQSQSEIGCFCTTFKGIFLILRSCALEHFDWKMQVNMKWVRMSVNRLDNFEKLLATTFLAKEAQMIGNFLGFFKNLTPM